MSAFNPYQQAIIDRIAATTERLEVELGLAAWLQIRHVFDAGHEGDTIGATDAPNLYGTCAITTPQWPYRWAQIRWFLPVAALLSDDELEQVAIHEYVHVLMHPVSQLVPPSAKDLGPREEFATESLSRAICHARGMKNVR